MTGMHAAITATDAIATYIAAKDSNAPELMQKAFADDCELQMTVKTDAVSFPSTAHGLAKVTDVLVLSFGQLYCDVHTFCLSRPSRDHLNHFRCAWLVGMAAKQDGAIRVGCGHYDWHFASDGRVKTLAIEIDVMNVLAAATSGTIMPWLGRLDYPWTSVDQVLGGFPDIDLMRPIQSYLAALHIPVQ